MAMSSILAIAIMAFLWPQRFFECEIAITDFRKLLGTNCAEGVLYQQRLDVDSGAADSGGFLFSGTFVVLRGKPSPGAKVLRGWKHGHIRSDFKDNAEWSKGLKTWGRHNKVAPTVQGCPDGNGSSAMRSEHMN